MRYVDEYRGAAEVRRCLVALRARVSRPWTLMEVCGGQTHALVRFGIDELLPPEVSLLHGPGCPVCVTPVSLIDAAVELASRPGAVVCSFGDMLRVPGSRSDLLTAKAAGGDVRVVYSPLDAVRLAERLPEREVVFFAVGFETTAPASALAVWEARRLGLRNFSLLVAHVLVPPAMQAMVEVPGRRVEGFLAAGHVCAIEGVQAYEPLARAWGVPVVVTGFEPLDLLRGILLCVEQLESGRAEVENAYARAVSETGNSVAQARVREVFEVVPRVWRGIGLIPGSGLALRPEWGGWDAARRFGLTGERMREEGECRSGEVLQGKLKPPECPAFGTRCTPETPLGATMVSSEGACAAWYRYRRRR